MHSTPLYQPNMAMDHLQYNAFIQLYLQLQLAASTHQEAMHQGQLLHRGIHLGYQCKVGCMCKACDLRRPQVEGQLTFNEVMFCIQDILHRLNIL